MMVHTIKARRGDASDGKGMIVDQDSAPDRARGSAEVLLPEAVTQYCDARATALVISNGDKAAGRRTNSQRFEEVPADPKPIRILDGAALREIEACTAPCEGTGENILVGSQSFPERIGICGASTSSYPRSSNLNLNQIFRPFDRQESQHDGIQHAEDGGVGADAEGESQHCHRREAGALGQHPQAVANVLNEGAHNFLLCAVQEIMNSEL